MLTETLFLDTATGDVFTGRDDFAPLGGETEVRIFSLGSGAYRALVEIGDAPGNEIEVGLTLGSGEAYGPRVRGRLLRMLRAAFDGYAAQIDDEVRAAKRKVELLAKIEAMQAELANL